MGNVRLTYADTDGNGSINPSSEIISEKNYYPGGLIQKGYNNTISANSNSIAQNFGFGGKENNPELGLDWMDFGARNYDASLMRWMNIDPLAEKMRRHSPYNYAFDNPVFFIDPDGMMPQRCCGNNYPNGVAGIGFTFGTLPDSPEKRAVASEVGEMIIDEIPIVGEAKDIAKGDYAGVLIGMVPGGKLLRKGFKKLKSFLKKADDVPKLKNADAILEGNQFEADQLQQAIDEGKDVTGRNRLVPENGNGNVAGNRTDTDQLERNADGSTFTIVETKRTSDTPLSTGQKTAKDHVENGNGVFETRTNQPSQNLQRGDKIQVTDYRRVNKIDNK